MAAFIQKLFRNRKTGTPAPAPTRTEPTPEDLDRMHRQEDQREQQHNALEANPSDKELETLAAEGLTAGIRIKAAEALEDTATLQRVQKKARGRDKGVYQAVRRKLQRIRETPKDSSGNFR